ncbi:hypothetical protein VDG44_09655 [Xanthomonas campestris pv. raphani]|uniref:hypothetical protein n=1 Tax=Xanthomonas campestris TaxID=339 RepID=UPI002B23C3BB|nr:hypothetical protein [Xanthomonas campestris]MEA9904822.1 hypothetical protein [Xanthomonas campestris pv. raphani]
MNYQIQLSDLDGYLIHLWCRAGRSVYSRRQFPAVYVDGVLVQINPAAILRVLVRGWELANLEDPDADIEPHLIEARGDLKGGKMKKRDKRFGFGADFWDWWHRIGKPHHGRDLESKEEADHWYRIYEESRTLVQTSWIAQFVPSLSYSERALARSRLSALAVDIVKNGFKL